MNYPTYNHNIFLTLVTPLGDQVLFPRTMQGEEKISGLFHFSITCTAKQQIDAQSLINKSATLTFSMPKNEKRYYNGVILAVELKQEAEGQFYVIHLAPKLALLQYRYNCRIFQNKTILQIIEQIFSEHGLKDYDYSKVRSMPPALEYCVQYQETDFVFVSRLLANYGIFYFHSHEANRHNLILADNKQAYIDNQSDAKLAHQHDVGIHSWQRSQNFFSGKWTLNAHDFTNANKKLLANQQTIISVGNNKNWEVYEYLDNYVENNQAEAIVKARIESAESSYATVKGKSSYANFFLGGIISLNEKLFPYEKGQRYVITMLKHEFSDINLQQNTQFYHNHFEAIDANQVCRPFIYNKPSAPGVQLGVVAGPQGKDIHTDEYGRMKVQFLWDREGKTDENSSCWIRAIQQWDGLLRIGTPVIIGFINDNIDKPIILGPVYNNNLMPLNSLPNEQTQSVLKRRHIVKNKEKLYNELRFEDKENNQLLSLYASKDMSVTVEQNFNQDVKKGNYVLKVKGDITIQAEGNISLESKKSITIQAGENIQIAAQKNIKMEAKMALQQNAGTKLSAEASEIQYQAKTKLSQKALEINHQADARIVSKASLHNVEADGLLTLKGGLIKEN